ncbi:MAG: type secretion system protein VirD4 [Solirubrobacteraceae bacterium]|nr:type secretion system protein VirD4 [Solirubrobacteraceae bacterium]
MNPRSSSRVGGTGDVVLLCVLGFLLAVGALVWAWGGLAGVLFGAGWPGLRTGQILGVLVRLPGSLADPARAWPAAVRSGLPGPVGFYAALFLVVAVASGAAVLAARSGVVGAFRGTGSPSGARWARGRELEPLRRGRRRARRAAPNAASAPNAAPASACRLGLGHHRGRLLRAEDRHALVAFGPPQSGKSAGLAVPALLEWDGPAVASSIKTDLLDATLARRRALGPVFIFDPFALAQAPSHTWSPLRGAGTWDGAVESAWRLTSAGELDQRRVEGGDFWAVAAEQRLAPLLYAAAAGGAGMDAVVRWAYGFDGRDLQQTLQLLADGAIDGAELDDARAAYDAARAFDTQADRTRASIEGTVQALLRAYRIARVARSAASCEITPAAVLDGHSTLYLVGDAKASKLLRPIFLALLSEIVDCAYERATLRGGRLELPLLLCLDEAGNVAPLPSLAEIASTAPSHNIQLVSIFHDLAQARSRYGQQAETVINSHRARMLLPGVADLETLRYFSGLVGEEEARDETRTIGDGGRTRSEARRRRPLASPESLRQLPDGEALLLYGRLPPVKIRLRMWFADRRLRRLAAQQPDRPEAPDALETSLGLPTADRVTP